MINKVGIVEKSNILICHECWKPLNKGDRLYYYPSIDEITCAKPSCKDSLRSNVTVSHYSKKLIDD